MPHHPARALEDAVGTALGTRVVDRSRMGASDWGTSWRMRLSGGREVFVKTSATREEVEVEAYGLGWLRDAHALATPEVLAVLDDPPALVLAWIESGRSDARGDEALGHGLAALHLASPGRLGLDRPGFIAGLPWDGGDAVDWATFYAERRLLPLLARAEREGRATQRIVRGITSVAARIHSLVGPSEPPARLHGDLWSGNLVWSAAGTPVLVDPAPYGGHREVDLAMMRMFGGFSTRTYAAYEEAYPLAPGHAERVPLYQLLPLLVHVIHFHGRYVLDLEAALRALA